MEILREIITAARHGFVYVHFYSGDIATEHVPVSETRVGTLELLGRNAFPLDLLVEFKSGGPVDGRAKIPHKRSG